jgi:hypothetical protein
MPPRAPTPVAWNVFLSSTVRDLKAYRLAIRTACRRHAQTTCLLSEEDWGGGYQDTVAKCLQQLAGSHGYLLVIGHWYGSIPPPGALPAGIDPDSRSITHLEFDAAISQWRQANPRPMAVMAPAPGRRADKLLKAEARKILTAEGINESEHAAALERFRQAVTADWKTVDQFEDKSDLLQLVVSRCLGFKGYTPSAAAAGTVRVPTTAVVSQVSDAQLGALGREPQLSAAKTLIAGLAARPDVPAVAMVVSGDQDAGQRALLLRLIDTVLKKYMPRREPSTLPVQCDTAAVVTWIGQSLGLPPLTAATPQSLAQAIAAELKRQPLMFAIDRIGDLADGVNTFRQDVWVPLYQELHGLRARDRFTNRLVAMVADYSGDASTFAASSTVDANPADGTLLRLLPVLGKVMRQDLFEWFDELDVPDDAAGRRAALADRVMKDSKGVPLRAFNRLRGEVLWPAGDGDE